MGMETSTPPIIDVLNDELLTDAQAAKIGGWSPVTQWRLRKKGRRINGRVIKMPAVRHGRNYVTTRECIHWFFQQAQLAGAEEGAQPRDQRSKQTVSPELDAECTALGI